jgi:hypothetical protein
MAGQISPLEALDMLIEQQKIKETARSASIQHHLVIISYIYTHPIISHSKTKIKNYIGYISQLEISVIISILSN